MSTSCPRRLLTTLQERPGIHMSWGGGEGRHGWLDAAWSLQDKKKFPISISKQERKPWSPGAAPLEHGERLQFNPLYSPKVPSLPPRLSAPLLRLQEVLYSGGDWLALQLRGKARGKNWGNGRNVPLPSQPGCLRLLLFPFVGAEPKVFSLTRQLWLRKRHRRVL
ncbi:hypothetical protein E2320_002029 [Naja naja]|nr:hypothetical protein E2320_002029 [Naja naja]